MVGKRKSRKELAGAKDDEAKNKAEPQPATKKPTRRTAKHKNQQKTDDTPTTDTERASAKTVTPEKPAQKRNRKTTCWVFKMKNGTTQTKFNKNDADEFKRDFNDIVESVYDFATKKEMNNFLATMGTAVAQTDTDIEMIVENTTADEKAKIDRITEMIEHAKPTMDINFYYKTTSKARIVIVIMRPLGINKDDMWLWKSKIFGEALKYVVTDSPTGNTMVNEFYTNLAVAKQRDLTKTPEDARLSYNEKDKRNYACFVNWSYFTLPLKDITNPNEEEAIIHSVIDNIHLTMRSCANGKLRNIFGAVLMNMMPPGLFRAISTPTRGPNWREYIVKSKRVVIKLDQLVTVVTRDESNMMLALLLKHQNLHHKYEPVQNENDNEADLENNESESDNDKKLPAKAQDDDDDSSDDDDDTPIKKLARPLGQPKNCNITN